MLSKAELAAAVSPFHGKNENHFFHADDRCTSVQLVAACTSPCAWFSVAFSITVCTAASPAVLGRSGTPPKDKIVCRNALKSAEKSMVPFGSTYLNGFPLTY